MQTCSDFIALVGWSISYAFGVRNEYGTARHKPCVAYLHGAAKSCLLFLPAMPPKMVSGIVTKHQMIRMMTMVPNGNAAVDCSRAQHSIRLCTQHSAAHSTGSQQRIVRSSHVGQSITATINHQTVLLMQLAAAVLVYCCSTYPVGDRNCV